MSIKRRLNSIEKTVNTKPNNLKVKYFVLDTEIRNKELIKFDVRKEINGNITYLDITEFEQESIIKNNQTDLFQLDFSLLSTKQIKELKELIEEQ